MSTRAVIPAMLLSIVCAANACAEQQDVESLPLFIQAKKADLKRYQFAVDKGATFHLTPDGKSFYLLWLPPKTEGKEPAPTIVTLHGHAGNAFNEFFLWYAEAAKRGCAIVALQWWFGQGEKPEDYYAPKELYAMAESILRGLKAPQHSVLLHGFSRGSANIYGVTAYDRSSKNDFVLLTVANAGKASPDFPVNKDIDKGLFGAKPFDGTHWAMYAGAADPHPDRDGVAGWRAARDWVTKHGGTVDLLIEDPKGDHGGFHRNPENMKAALDVFEKLLAKEKEGKAKEKSAAPAGDGK